MAHLYNLTVNNATGHQIYLSIGTWGKLFTDCVGFTISELGDDPGSAANFETPIAPGGNYSFGFYRTGRCSGDQGYVALRACYAPGSISEEAIQFDFDNKGAYTVHPNIITYKTSLDTGANGNIICTFSAAAKNPELPDNISKTLELIGPLLIRNKQQNNRDILGLASDWEALDWKGPPLISPYEKTQWWLPLNHPQLPSRSDSSFLQDVLRVATVASFAIPEVGALIATGVTAAEIALKQGSGSQQVQLVGEIKKAVGEDFRQVLMKNKIDDTLNHFQSFVDWINPLYQKAWEESLPANEATKLLLQKEIEDFFNLATWEVLDQLANGPYEVPKDLAVSPTFNAIAIEVWLYCVSIWLWANKVGCIISPYPDLVPNPDNKSEINKQNAAELKKFTNKHNKELFSSNESQMYVTNIVTYLPQFIKSAKNTIAAMEAAIIKRLSQIVDRGVSSDPPPGEVGHYYWNGEKAGVVGVTVVDNDLEADGFAKDNLVRDGAEIGIYPFPYTMGIDGQSVDVAPGIHYVAIGVMPDETAILPPALKTRVFMDGRAWLCYIAEKYARSWHYTSKADVDETIEKWSQMLKEYEGYVAQ